MSQPFEATFAKLRRGAASLEATEELNKVVKAVCDSGKPAKLVIEITVKPNTKNKGMVEAVILSDKIMSKIPQTPGESVLFVNSKLELVTNNERQGDLFPEIRQEERKFIDIDEDGVIHQPHSSSNQ